MRKKNRKPGSGPRWAAFVPAALRLNASRSSRGLRCRAWLAAAAVMLLCVLPIPGLVAKEKNIPRVVTGAVLDEAENPIASAAVVLTDLQTGKKTATYTKEDGLYLFSDLRSTRDYEVQASYKGMFSQVRKVSMFDNRNKIVLNLNIPPPKE